MHMVAHTVQHRHLAALLQSCAAFLSCPACEPLQGRAGRPQPGRILGRLGARQRHRRIPDAGLAFAGAHHTDSASLSAVLVSHSADASIFKWRSSGQWNPTKTCIPNSVEVSLARRRTSRTRLHRRHSCSWRHVSLRASALLKRLQALTRRQVLHDGRSLMFK